MIRPRRPGEAVRARKVCPTGIPKQKRFSINRSGSNDLVTHTHKFAFWLASNFEAPLKPFEKVNTHGFVAGNLLLERKDRFERLRALLESFRLQAATTNGLREFRITRTPKVTRCSELDLNG